MIADAKARYVKGLVVELGTPSPAESSRTSLAEPDVENGHSKRSGDSIIPGTTECSFEIKVCGPLIGRTHVINGVNSHIRVYDVMRLINKKCFPLGNVPNPRVLNGSVLVGVSDDISAHAVRSSSRWPLEAGPMLGGLENNNSDARGFSGAYDQEGAALVYSLRALCRSSFYNRRYGN